MTREIDVPGFGPRRFYLYVPPDYDGTRPVPLMLTLHGQAGSSAGATDLAATMTRDRWTPAAVAGNFIVLAPAAHSPQGSWVIPDSYVLLDAGIADALARYNIDQNRIHAWGFSAGANLLHALALGRSGQFATYAVHAGSLLRGAGISAPSLATRRLPLELWVGNGDSVYLPEVTADRDRFITAGWTLGNDLQFTVFNGGHTVQFSQIWSRSCRFAVVDQP